MLIEFVLALIVGILVGVCTGLFPGIHINLISAALIASLAHFQNFSPMTLVVFIVAMSITHTFLDFIPSIYLGAPDSDSFLSVLPGHQMLRNGKGHEAVAITLIGSLISFLPTIIFTFVFIYFLPSFYSSFISIIPYVLIFLSFYLIFREELIGTSLVVFLLAGYLGFLSFNLPVKEPLLPLLSGLFGISSLILSLKDSPFLPEQETSLKIKSLFDKRMIKPFLAGSFIAPIFSFIPGTGSGHAATLASEFTNTRDLRGFLLLVGITNTIIMTLSFVTLYAINRTRSGSAAAVKDILKTMTLQNLTTIILVAVITGFIAFFLGLAISKLAAKNISKISYKKLSIATIIILVGVNFFLTNWLGILVLITSSALGVFAIRSNSRRINLMGALIIPTIIYYLIN